MWLGPLGLVSVSTGKSWLIGLICSGRSVTCESNELKCATVICPIRADHVGLRLLEVTLLLLLCQAALEATDTPFHPVQRRAALLVVALLAVFFFRTWTVSLCALRLTCLLRILLFSALCGLTWHIFHVVSIILSILYFFLKKDLFISIAKSYI